MRSNEILAAGFRHFCLKRDLLGTFLWAAITASWTWELVVMDWSFSGDGPVCAVTAFCYMEL
jgi:hypothetical protein